MKTKLKTESAVKDRYAAGAKAQEPALCCPVVYDPEYLKVIPDEVIERDYGCGDPSKYVKSGETVLDLGSGTGKICFIASQVVGAEGTVIGVDMTDDMLQVARDNAPVVAERIGYANVEFRKGRIQDLALDLDAFEKKLAAEPVADANAYLKAEETAEEMRVREPMIADESIDVVVSNCVLNLVSVAERQKLFAEVFRVLKVGGRAVISDIVCDEDVPLEMQEDAELWSGCISGAFREDQFLQAFEDAGFYGVRILKLDKEPWQTVGGIEFRSMTVEATKGSGETCLERNQAVIYKGPFKSVVDDDGHLMERGKRYAVCDRTFKAFRNGPFADAFEFIEPRVRVPIAEAAEFDCTVRNQRPAAVSKAPGDNAATGAGDCCDPNGSCC